MVKIWQSFYATTKIEKPKFPREFPLPTVSKYISDIYRWIWKNSGALSRDGGDDDDDEKAVVVDYNDVKTFTVRF